MNKTKIMIFDSTGAIEKILLRCLPASSFDISNYRLFHLFLRDAFDFRADVFFLNIDEDAGGYFFSKLISETNPQALVFFFSENLFEAKKIEGLKMGAVDFFSFTSSLPETELRLRTLLTHLHRKIQKTNKDKDDLNFIPEGNLLIRGTKKRRLTAREFGIIKALNDSFPNVVCRDKIISLVNNMDGDSERVIDVHISSLRKKVRDLDILIRTIRGKGYVLEFP